VENSSPTKMPSNILNEQGVTIAKDDKNQLIAISIDELVKVCQELNGNAKSNQTVIGNPGPLGLGGFALTTFVLSVFNTGVILDSKFLGIVLPLALFYGGLAQFVAGIWEYRVGNTFGATAFCSYGSFWMSFAAYVQIEIPELGSTDSHEPLGLFLFVWLIFTLYMFVGSLRVSRAVASVFFTLSITFILLVIGTLAQNPRTSQAGGWMGIICACCAWYSSAAIVINKTWGRTVLPVGEIESKEYGFKEVVMMK